MTVVFYNLGAGVTQADLKCHSSDSSDLTHNLSTPQSFPNQGLTAKTCYYSSVSSQTTYAMSAAAGTVSCNKTITVLVNESVPPSISSVSASATLTNATVSWTTDRASTSVVEYGLNNATLGSWENRSDLVTSHSVVVGAATPLASNTTYYYRVWSCVQSSACNVSSIRSFTTSAPALTYSFNVNASTDSLSINKSISNETYRTYLLTNNGTANLSSFTCASNQTGWVTVASGCPGSLAVGANSSVNFLYNASSQAVGAYSILITFTETTAGSRTLIATVTVT